MIKVASDTKIGIIGLGYVGLPLAIEFGKLYRTIGFDINNGRIYSLKNGEDRTREATSEEIRSAHKLEFTSEPEGIADCDVYIVTVPTPINGSKQPDLTPLEAASELVGKCLNPGNIVIFESTVFPGATEEVCVPLLEKYSSLSYNKDFFCGYSPERINPGDKEHRVINILKVTSGSNSTTADFVDSLYQSIIKAGTFKASSIKVAEAAKVIENTQRDVNIALVNELAIIFDRLGIDTEEVLKAAGTKWNFLPFRPGLVGGHCIGVDPYYLTYKSQSVGYHPEIILAGRRLNDGMGDYVAHQLVKAMLKKRIHVHGSKVLVLGLTFKENCPDIRNTKVIDVIDELREFGVQPDCYDPWVNADEAEREFGIKPLESLQNGVYDGIIIAVAHKEFLEMGAAQIHSLGKSNHVLYDLKYLFPSEEIDVRL